MSNDRYLKTYVPMKEVTDELTGKARLEEMEIEVYYTLGGPNYWTGGETRRGIYLSFWPVTRDKSGSGVTTCTRTVGDDRGRRMLLQEQKRRNDAHGIQWAKFVKNNLDAIAQAAIAQNWEGVAHVVRHGSADKAA
jgi:hypothetical protein